MGELETERLAGPAFPRLAPPTLKVRLSPDGLQLQAFLSPDAAMMPPDTLASVVRDECVRLAIQPAFTARDLARQLRAAQPGTWVTLLSGTAPTPPIDGSVELLLAPGTGTAPPRRDVVRAGALLARLHPPLPGQPGCDVQGRVLAAQPARAASLPRGENTYLAPDGLALYAGCDGSPVLRGDLVHVVPMQLHEGDVTEEMGPLTIQGALAVLGSVRDTRVRAGGDVLVQGDVESAHVESLGGDVEITGSLRGGTYRRCTVRAAGSITCAGITNADLHAGRDLCLQEAQHSLLQAGGNLVLGTTLEHGLHDVTLELAGGVLPVIDPAGFLAAPSGDRQHVRVATRLEAAIACHDHVPLIFTRCTVVDVSTSGLRCQLHAPLDMAPHSLVQLKLGLPGSTGQVFIIARESRTIGPGMIALSAVGMTQDDQHRLREYCLQLLLARKHSRLPTRDDRGGYQ